MDTRLLDFKLSELFGLAKKHKLEVIRMLIDSIADSKAYDVEAYYENEKGIVEKENKELKEKIWMLENQSNYPCE